MSKPMRERGLVIATEVEEATVWCVRAGCPYRQRWIGKGSHSEAVEAAKRHAETTGHRVHAEHTRAVEYDNVAVARDSRLAPRSVHLAPL